MKDSKSGNAISVVSDSTHGTGLIPKSGTFEIMLERRCVNDDGRGVGEVLNSSRPLQNKFWVSIDNSTDSAIFQRKGFLLQNFALTPTVLNTNLNWGKVQLPSGGINELPLKPQLVNFTKLSIIQTKAL